MRATVWSGRNTVQVENVPDPKILNERDAIVKITSTAICGSDLHLYDGYVPTMKRGDILGHEFMGDVVEVGRGVRNLSVGDRVVVPFPIACGSCWMCRHELYSLCENSNPNAGIAEKMFGHPTAGIFGYSHITGGYAGGQAEYARVPFADVGPLKIEDDLPDEQVLFLSDILPTGYMGAEFCEISGGEVVAVFGAGPVGQFAITSAVLLGAERVIAIDQHDYRLQMARNRAGATDVIDFSEDPDIVEQLKVLTGGRGPALKAGQCHVQRYLRPLYERIRNGELDPSFVVTHRLQLDMAPDAYEVFKHKQDECVKVVLPERTDDAHAPQARRRHAARGRRLPARQIRTAGAIHAGYSTLTDYPLGIVKLLPYKAHLALDGLGALALAATPFLTGQFPRGRRHWVPHVALCAFELASLAMTDPTSKGDFHGDVEAVRPANTEDPHRKIHEPRRAVTPAAA